MLECILRLFTSIFTILGVWGLGKAQPTRERRACPVMAPMWCSGLRFKRNALRQRTTLTDPDGGVRTITFDNDGNLSKFVDPSGRTTTMQYDLADRRTTVIFASGLTRAFTYDAANQTVSIIDTGTGGSSLARWTFVYDAVGNRSVVRDNAGASTTYS